MHQSQLAGSALGQSRGHCQPDCGYDVPQRFEGTGAAGYHPYPKGIKVSDDEFASIRLIRDDFHGEWNYTIEPNTS